MQRGGLFSPEKSRRIQAGSFRLAVAARGQWWRPAGGRGREMTCLSEERGQEKATAGCGCLAPSGRREAAAKGGIPAAC